MGAKKWRIGLPLVLLVALASVALMSASSALAGSVVTPASDDPSGDGIVPVLTADENPTCADIGFGDIEDFKIDNDPVSGTYYDGLAGFTIDVYDTPSGPVFDWEPATDNVVVYAVIAKGGNLGANAFVYYVPADDLFGDEDGDTLLHPPLAGQSGKYAGLSHVNFCYAWKLDVSKTANTSLTRTYDWTIDKSADQDDLGELSAEQAPITVNYEVLVDLDDPASVDSDHQVTGTITIENNTPLDAKIDAITDLIQPGDISPDTLECEDEVGDPFVPPATLAAGDTVTCEYSAGPLDPDERFGDKNTVEVTTDDEESDVLGDSAEAEIDWDAATITHVDECIDVYDDSGTSGVPGDDVFLGTVCAFETDEETGEFAPPPKTFEFSTTFGPPGSGADVEFECGENEYTNVASFVTNDNEGTGDDDHTITAFQNCPEVGDGCSLTIGYWKTHAGFGPQADVVTPLLPILLGTSGGAKTQNVTSAALAVQFLKFNGSNNVFAASNGINKLYAQLLGAKLSIAAGADGSAIATTIALADAFLATKNSTNWSGLTNAQKATVNGWVSTLDQFNNGIIGPGHCGSQEGS
jgi:hypothetical protein